VTLVFHCEKPPPVTLSSILATHSNTVGNAEKLDHHGHSCPDSSRFRFRPLLVGTAIVEPRLQASSNHDGGLLILLLFHTECYRFLNFFYRFLELQRFLTVNRFLAAT
jgi:hypothetical protein